MRKPRTDIAPDIQEIGREVLSSIGEAYKAAEPEIDALSNALIKEGLRALRSGTPADFASVVPQTPTVHASPEEAKIAQGVRAAYNQALRRSDAEITESFRQIIGNHPRR